MKAFREVLLREVTGASELRCWLDVYTHGVHRGATLTLEAMPDRIWRVVSIGVVEQTAADLFKPWRVGGLT